MILKMDCHIAIIVLLLLHVVRIVNGKGDTVVLNTGLGSVEGTRQVLQRSMLAREAVTNEVDTFISIPYAQPPVRELRFANPRPIEAWKQGRDSRLGVERFSCWGATMLVIRNYTQQEDCLYLNIYKPHEAGNAERVYPVMVYIHGGSWIAGSANDYDGTLLATRGVVIVTINYRLGALGLITSGDSRLPGNYAIRDQIAALTWVKSYIKSFHGNPDQVTIFGNSAGGASMGLLMISPLAKGLFHGVIHQSGSALAYWSFHYDRFCNLRNRFDDYLDQVGCPKGQEMLTCLRQKDPKELFEAPLLSLVEIRQTNTYE